MLISRKLAVPCASLLALLHLQQAVHGYPGDVFEQAAPARAPSTTTQVASQTETHSVSDGGAAQYSIPIAVPPGRKGLTPTLALTYSSSNPVRGGLAAGWSFDMPRIEVDTSQGRLGEHDAPAATTYRSSLSGSDLVKRIEPGPAGAETYRATLDTAYLRYERFKTSTGETRYWRARDLGGTVYHFGTSSMSRDAAHALTGPGTRESRFFLTQIVDAFGNQVNYTYQKAWSLMWDGSRLVPVDIYPTVIEYGANTAAAQTSNVRIELAYASEDYCPGSFVPIGSQFTYRTGFPLMEGARRLTSILVKVRTGTTWTERRRYDLGYDMTELACPTGRTHAPLRLLTSVQESAIAPDGMPVTLPPTTFEYGRRELELTERLDMVPSATGKNALSPAKGGGWPTLDSMLLDLDGDGRLDLLWSHPTDSPTECRVTWQRNLGDGDFSGAADVDLPTMRWRGNTRFDTTDPNQRDLRETCSLSHQFSRVEMDVPGADCGPAASYQSYRFMDVTGDSRPDLVTAIDTNRGRYLPEEDDDLWAADPVCPDDGACRDAGGDPLLCPVVSPLSTPPYWDGSSTTSAPAPEDDDPGSPSCPFETCPQPGCNGAIESCPCDAMYCSNHQLWLALGSEFSPPVDNSGGVGGDGYFWSGAARSSGDNGGDGRAPMVGNAMCQQWPEVQCGRYVWRVYTNEGSGSFSEAPEVVLSPLPLESDRATSALGAGSLAASSSWHGFIDLDGDGYLDAVYMAPFWSSTGSESGAPPSELQVFRGDGSGHFHGDPGASGAPYAWKAPALYSINASGLSELTRRARIKLASSGYPEAYPYHYPPAANVRYSGTTVTLEDVNGDGLPDYVDNRGDQRVRVFYNTGRGFENPFWFNKHRGSSLETSAWGTEKYTRFDESQQLAMNVFNNSQLEAGWSRTVSRPIDIDLDGLLDLVVIQAPRRDETNPWNALTSKPRARLFVNVGDKLIPMGETSKLDAWWPALSRITLTNGVAGDQASWDVKTDFLDLDGDGLPEAYTNDELQAYCTPDPDTGVFHVACGQTPYSLTSPRDGQGMRLLRQVQNGKGATVRFDYEPKAAEPDAGSGRVPHPVWVVSHVTGNAGPAADGAASPDSVTRYAYARPVYNQDDDGEWGFRGFQQLRVVEPSGAEVVTTFDHALHWGGLAAEVRRHDSAGGRLHAFTRTTWRRDALSDEIPTYHARVIEQRTCGASQTAAQCETGGDARYQTDNWVATQLLQQPGAPIIHYVLESTTVSEGAEPTPGAQKTSHTSLSYATSSTYRMNADLDQRYERVGASWNQVGKTQHVWDPSLRTEVQTKAWVSDDATLPPAITTRTFDMLTGNQTSRRVPEQVSTTYATSFAYDPTKTFVTRTVNEFGHAVDDTYDPATGVQMSRRGPNAKNGVQEGWSRRIDGVGRSVEETQYVDGGNPVGTSYVPVIVTRVRYFDFRTPALSGHSGTISEGRIEIAEDRWTTFETHLDGAGRVVTARELVAGSPVAVSRQVYDAAGRVVRSDLPSPEQTGTATVTQTFEVDAHGRPTLSLRPDQTGQRWTYDGRWITRTDVVGDVGGTVSTTRTRGDAFGRQVEVGEQLDDGAWATTTYAYDGNDNLVHVTDADGYHTDLKHDWLSRRIQITRGGGTWKYRYDRDGNPVSIVSPHASWDNALAYTTTIVHDRGREVSRLAGNHALSSDQLQRYGAASVTRFYDENPTDGGIGRLSRIVTSSGMTTYRYGARGLVRERTDSFKILGDSFAGERTTRYTHNALGRVSEEIYGDAVAPDAPTRMAFTSNDRGLPRHSSWMNSNDRLATHFQTAAGFEYARYDTSPGYTEGIYRDALGRVVNHSVRFNLPATNNEVVRTEVHYGYGGSDDVETMRWALAPTGDWAFEDFAFDHDSRHQITEAIGPAGYEASFGYSPAGRIGFARVDADVAAVDVPRRDVFYDYDGDQDPDTVDRLVTPNVGVWLDLDHDAAGNTTARSQGANAWSHVYDGFDHQREVVVSDGRREVYWYDGEGQRTVVATYASGATVPDQVRWSFADTEIWYAGNGSITKTIAHVSRDGASLARIENRTQLEYVFSDHHDHTLAVIRADGTLVAGFVYGPFGEILRQAGAEVPEVLRRFNGKEHDETSDLSYYGKRYYDPLSLTWTQADPLYRFVPDLASDEPRRMTPYAFSMNNPLRYFDPDGADGDEVSLTLYVMSKSTALYTKSWEGGELQAGVFEASVSTDGVNVSATAVSVEAGAGPIVADAKVGAVGVTAGKDGVAAEATLFEAGVGVDAGPVGVRAKVGVGVGAGYENGKIRVKVIAGVGGEITVEKPPIRVPVLILVGVTDTSSIWVATTDEPDQETGAMDGETSSNEAAPPVEPPKAPKKAKERKKKQERASCTRRQRPKLTLTPDAPSTSQSSPSTP